MSASPPAGGNAPRVSLKARALRLLAQREHSRTELRRKLMPHALAAACSTAAEPTRQAQAPVPALGAAPAGPAAEADNADSAPGPCLDRLLDWLEAHGYLSSERFVESRVHARASRFGARRIVQELSQHGLKLDADTADALRRSEFDRARAVWQRRFGTASTDRAEQARQARFLAARGFSPDVIRRLVRGLADDD